MYDEQIALLKSLLPGTPQDVLDFALAATDGDVTRAMNQILDRQQREVSFGTRNTTESGESATKKNRIPEMAARTSAAAPVVPPTSTSPQRPADLQPPPRSYSNVVVEGHAYKLAESGYNSSQVSPGEEEEEDEEIINILGKTEECDASVVPIERAETILTNDVEIRSPDDDNDPNTPDPDDDIQEELEEEVQPQEVKTLPNIPTILPSELEVQVKILVPRGVIPKPILKQHLDDILKRCYVKNYDIQRESLLVRAEYEEQVDEWRMNLILAEVDERNRIQRLISMLERFCFYSSVDLHDQMTMEVPSIPAILNTISTQHVSVPVASIAVGNCANNGLFFVRGNYVASYNSVSNRAFMYVRKDRNRSQETSQFKAAGNQPYTSYANFEHDRRLMTILFAVQLPEEQQDGLMYAGYRIVIQYNAIVQIVVDLRDSNMNSLFLRLKYPPNVWEATPRGQPYQQRSRRVMNLEQTREWVRVLQWAGDDRSKGCSREALSDCQWLQIAFPKKDEEQNVDPSVTLIEIVSRIMTRSTAKVSFGAVFGQLKRLPVVTDIDDVGSFRANYALKALISRGSVVTDQLFDYVETDSPTQHVFFKYVAWCMKECSRACEEALENLLCAVDERRTIDVLRAFHHMYKVRVEAYKRLALGATIKDISEVADLRKSLPKNCVMVRKVMVTPLRILFMAPEVMMTNRVVRHFGQENALRCVFRDDSGNRLTVKDFLQGSNSDQQSAIIAEIVQRTLSHGVQIHDRRYFFLAWSNSQMRDHGCYMYAPVMDPTTGDVLVSVEQMREWMGDFSGVKNVPKLMSRMGQCFTQAQPTVTLTPDMWTVIDDITGGEGHPESNEKYCYSDGCGKLAPSVARQISIELQLEIIPSCFQVRFKGFKGVLAIDPTLDLLKNGPKVVFRKSQQKFHDTDESEEGTVLEIVKYSMPSPVCLNRPMITILDQVAEAQSKTTHATLCRKIHYYLERELSVLGSMLLNEKAAAEELTQRINLPIDFVRLRQSGFSLTNEPFIRKMLVSIYRYNISNHLTKAKIFLPGNKGRSMYGIVDETGLLQYGQVFIQYSPSLRRASDKPKIHLGRVLITKNPCHVPGDVRMFEAVDQPSLRHLIDVVVFPRWGPRPHADEMAGSDLDGDEYSVVFDQDIQFDRNEEAMVFPKSHPEEFDGPPATEDMVDFFLKYLRQDSIGRMSNAHLIYADRRGLFDEIANEIARKCSIAVDFPKSGEPAEPLTPMEQCDVVPDYMFSAVKPMYRSPRLNGQLYRKAKKVEEVLELTENIESIFEKDVDKVMCPEDVNLFQGEEELKSKFRRLRDEYATRMQQLLDEYGINDEAAVVSGHIVSLKRLTAMERDDYSFYHTDKIVELRYAKIFYHFRAVFLQEFGNEEDLYDTDPSGAKVIRADRQMHLKARRWYYIAYVDNRNNHRAPGPCRSFPWVVWDVLASYKRERLMTLGTATIAEHPVADALETAITDFIIRSGNDYKEFSCELRETEGIIQRYVIAYGDPLVQVLYVLYNWLSKEELFSCTQMTMHHVALLFIQFCRGIRFGYNGTADSTAVDIIFPEPAPNPPRVLIPDNGCYPMNTARSLIDFLRYTSSQKFALADNINLRIDDEPVAPVLLRSNTWIPLSQLAFRTYHHIAVSGRFDALRFYREAYDWTESESKEPIVVSSSLLGSQGYNQTPLQPKMVLETLKMWTGVSSIHSRLFNQGRRNSVTLCTIVGTVAARQRLARLLQMPVDKLRRAVLEDRMPLEVRDMSL